MTTQESSTDYKLELDKKMYNMSQMDTYISVPIIYALNGLQIIIYNALVWISNKWTEFCQSEFVQKMGLNVLWAWSGFCLKVEGWGQQMYDGDYTVKVYVDSYYFICELIERLFERRLREPEADNWINVCTTKCNNSNDEIIYFETYKTLKNPGPDEIKQSFEEASASIYSSDNQENKNCRDTIIVMKTDDAYTVRLCKLGNDAEMTDNYTINSSSMVDMVASSYGLMSVTYSNPKMTEQIMLDIPKEMYLVGNQLFSPAFVYRALAYQNKRFVFDLNYTIHLIDNNINQFQLNSREYLTIDEADGLVSQIQQ